MHAEMSSSPGDCHDGHVADGISDNKSAASHGFVIPKIVITRAPERPQYSQPIPEQTYDKAVLFVPVKTEELSWDSGGLYWNGTYAYPVHNIYNREGENIGRRRNGPAGYRFSQLYDAYQPSRSVFDDDDEDSESSGLRSSQSSAAGSSKNATVSSNEEAKVVLEEPAPLPLGPSDTSDEVEIIDFVTPSISTIEEDATDDGSLCGESETVSLFSRRESTDSSATTPGVSTPPPSAEDVSAAATCETSSLDSGLLCQKLEAEAAKDRTASGDTTTPDDAMDDVDTEPSTPFVRQAPGQSWAHLGTIPRRTPGNNFTKQRACTLPDHGKDVHGFSKSLSLNTALDISKKHRSVSVPASPILDDLQPPAPLVESPPASPAELPQPLLESGAIDRPLGTQSRQSQHRRSGSDGSRTDLSSIADGLTRSAFSGNRRKEATVRRSSTLSSKPSIRRKHRCDEFAFNSEYSAGWAFEQGASALCDDWQIS